MRTENVYMYFVMTISFNLLICESRLQIFDFFQFDSNASCSFQFRAHPPFHMPHSCNLPLSLLIPAQLLCHNRNLSRTECTCFTMPQTWLRLSNISNTRIGPHSALSCCQAQSHPISLRMSTPDPQTRRYFWCQRAFPYSLISPLRRPPLRTCHSTLSVPASSRQIADYLVTVCVHST
jgi:hypothetical protein